MGAGTCVPVASKRGRPILRQRRAKMNKEYLIAKADLCKDLAIEQLTNGENEEGVKNLKRMIRALEEINLINYLEERRGRE
jgi:hypothetical protein